MIKKLWTRIPWFRRKERTDALPKDAQLSWLDYLLSATAACLSAWSAGMGLHLSEISYFFVVLILGGTLVSFALQTVLPERAARYDGLLYALAAIIAITQAFALNSLLAEGGFPRQLILAGVLCWMLSLGSLALWRDLTLLFQAVPCIAIFGLVGTWDTFPGATYAFFGFLLCFAALFARAHRRQMLNLAILSGYPRIDTIKQGPWRWMAGPEWALGSAAIILLLSFLGAPVIQQSVQGIAGRVRVPTPSTMPTPIQPGSGEAFRTSSNGTISRIGQGPTELTDSILMYVTMEEQRYLRSRTYGAYESGGWEVIKDFANRDEMVAAFLNPESMFSISREAIKNPVHMPFSIELVEPLSGSIPVPGEVDQITGVMGYGFRPDGSVALLNRVTGAEPIRGTVRIPPPNAQPVNAGHLAPELYSDPHEMDPIPADVRALAKQVVEGKQTDFDRAKAIQHEIESRCRYNLNAAATPGGKDPVENFLFVAREGYCDLFASAMVTMARSVGLPARYATGYYPRVTDIDSQGRYRIRESDAHAWAEVFFQDVGWVVFDATEGAQVVPGGERGKATASVTWYERPWAKVSLIVAAGLSLATCLYFLARSLIAASAAKRAPKLRLNRLYHEFVRHLERATGKPRRPSQTPMEYLDTIEPMLPAMQDEVASLTEQFVSSFYSPGTPTTEAIEELKESVKQVGKGLRNAGGRKSIIPLNAFSSR